MYNHRFVKQPPEKKHDSSAHPIGHEHLKTPLGPLKNGGFLRRLLLPGFGLRLASSLRIKTGGLDDLLLNRSWELCCTSPTEEVKKTYNGNKKKKGEKINARVEKSDGCIVE